MNLPTFFQNPIILTLTIFITTYLALVFLKFLLTHASRLAKNTKTDWDDIIFAALQKINWPFYIVTAAYITTTIIPQTEKLNFITKSAFLIIATIYFILATQSILRHGIKKLSDKLSNDSASLLRNLSGLIIGILWVIGTLFVLANLGYNVSSLIAGLGIGGVAIAFALQSTLSDLFGAFSILFDKPFKNGEFIQFDDHSGTVIRTGLRTTRIRTLQGEELIVSNQDLLKSRVKNFHKMEKRRIQFNIGITYETPLTKIHLAKQIITKAINDEKNTELNRVYFKQFGDSALIFDIVYLVTTRDYATYMNIQENINFTILEQFEKEKINIAYPTQRILVEKS